MMDDMILSTNTLPYPLHSRIHSDKVLIQEKGGIIMLMPVESAAKSAEWPKEYIEKVMQFGETSDETFAPPPELPFADRGELFD